MWSYKLFGASTVYFDKAKTWSLATIAAFETHSKKEGTNIRVGNLLTLEGNTFVATFSFPVPSIALP